MGSAASIPRCFKPTAALSADDSGEGTVGSAPRDDAVAGGRLAAPQRSGGRDEGLYQFYSILFYSIYLPSCVSGWLWTVYEKE